MSAYTHIADCSTGEPCPRCFEFGVTTERARIIALLEAEKDEPPFYTKSFLIEHFIALIKGEAETK